MYETNNISSGSEEGHKTALHWIVLGALGVVFGDIGTSPLYALRECFVGSGLPLTTENVNGILSLIFWALTIIISFKYTLFIMRADNHGEGGILALLALLSSQWPHERSVSFRARALTLTALFGAALLYGDGTITAAISVLSAVEGLEVATPVFTPYIEPITLIILTGLFWMQRHGTGRIGAVFGPIILLWFVAIGAFGVHGVIDNPSVLWAFSPTEAFRFLAHHGSVAFLVLGSVFLVVTGGEALSADMGHFGRFPIKLGWYCIVLPGLMLNYLGQGALLLSNPAALKNPFFFLVPNWALYPTVGLAMIATVIASQAIISGAFSLTRQAVQLGFLPRLQILHTSSSTIGQIYVPLINATLYLATVWLVLEFKSSSNLANAYGIAVASTMLASTVLMVFVPREIWGWSWWKVAPVAIFFGSIDLVFLTSNCLKFFKGGWFPIVCGVFGFVLMLTWRRGQELLTARMRSELLPLESFIHEIAENPPARVPGTAVFLSRRVEGASPALLHSVSRLKALHERVVVIRVKTADIPYVDPADRVQIERLGHGFYRVVGHYGFMESPDVPLLIRMCEDHGLAVDRKEITFILGRETVIPTSYPGMAQWREELFSFMSRNATHPAFYFNLPRSQVLEIGVQIEI